MQGGDYTFQDSENMEEGDVEADSVIRGIFRSFGSLTTREPKVKRETKPRGIRSNPPYLPHIVHEVSVGQERNLRLACRTGSELQVAAIVAGYFLLPGGDSFDLDPRRHCLDVAEAARPTAWIRKR